MKFELGLRRYPSSYGVSHPWEDASQYDLAVCAAESGRFHEAFKLYERLHSERAARLGDLAQPTLDAMKGMAQAYQAAGKNLQAISKQESLIEKLRQLYQDADGSAETGRRGQVLLAELVHLHIWSGLQGTSEMQELVRAQECYVEELRFKDLPGLTLATVADGLARAHSHLGHLSCALTWSSEALGWHQQAHGEQDLRTLSALMQVGLCHLQLGNGPAAYSACSRWNDISTEVYCVLTASSVRGRMTFARVCLYLGQRNTAFHQMLSIDDDIIRVMGEKNVLRRDVVLGIADLAATRQGRPAEEGGIESAGSPERGAEWRLAAKRLVEARSVVPFKGTWSIMVDIAFAMLVGYSSGEMAKAEAFAVDTDGEPIEAEGLLLLAYAKLQTLEGDDRPQVSEVGDAWQRLACAVSEMHDILPASLAERVPEFCDAAIKVLNSRPILAQGRSIGAVYEIRAKHWYRGLRNAIQAEADLEQSIASFERELGPDHPETVRVRALRVQWKAGPNDAEGENGVTVAEAENIDDQSYPIVPGQKPQRWREKLRDLRQRVFRRRAH